MARATAQPKVEELSSELISHLEIPFEQNEEVAEAALPPSEAHWEGTLDSDLEEKPGIEYSDEKVYLSEGGLELGDTVSIASQVPKQNAFEVMMGEAYKGNNVFNKASFRYQRGPELSNKQKKRKTEQEIALDTKQLTTH
jgi:hypothetical protein